MATRYIALGPLMSGEGSRAFLGLKVSAGEASPVALIWVPETVMREPELVEQLRRDTSRAAALEHPNVLRVHGLIEVDEGLARVAEYANGETLRRVLEVTIRLPPPFAARAAADAALGVQYAHLAGNEDGTPLVHGDLRPETLMVAYSGLTKVSGYGALNVAPKEMGGQRVMGRRLHCAPEQILGGREAMTAQTDVYLLGLILLESLTGAVPFQGEKNFDKAVLTRIPPMLSSEYVPPRLRPVIGKAMAKKGPQRFATAQAFREAIEDAVGELATYEEFAAFLDKAFQGDEKRAARQRELDNGIQEWVVKKGLKLAPPPKLPEPPPRRTPPAEPAPEPVEISDSEAEPIEPEELAKEPASSAPVEAPPTPNALAAAKGPADPAPIPSVIVAFHQLGAAESEPVAAEPEPVVVALDAPPPAPASPAAAVPKPALPPRRPTPERVAEPDDEEDEDEEPRTKGLSPWAVVVPLMVVAVGVAFWFGKHSQPEKFDYKPPAAAGLDAARVAVVEPPDAEAVAAVEPPVAPPIPTPTPKPAPVAIKPVPATLELTTEPPLNVSIDGKPAGKTPLQTEVSVGPHRLTFSDPELSLRVVRKINAKPGNNPFSLTLGKGSVTVTCPPGAEVRIDKKTVGTTPLAGPVPVFEGEHRIQVSKGSAKWQQDFTVGADERMNFEVEITGD